MPSSTSQSPPPIRTPDCKQPKNVPGPRRTSLYGARFAFGSEHLLAMVDGIDHHHLEEILELALEQFHQCAPKLGAGIAGTRLKRRDVVLGDVEPSCQLALGQMVLLPHRLE